MDERTTSLDKEQHSVDTTMAVKQVSLFEVMDERTTIFDKQHPSVYKTVQSQHEGTLHANAVTIVNTTQRILVLTLKYHIKMHVHIQQGVVLYSCE